MRNERLSDVASRLHRPRSGAKPLEYYEKYEKFLERIQLTPRNILEIGVYEGESMRIFAEAYPDSLIVGVDISLMPNLPIYPNVVYRQLSQTDSSGLKEMVLECFPRGVDLVIDDASHIGSSSKIAFETLFPLLRSGGAYFIEDWGTGYWESWPDGSRYFEPRVIAKERESWTRIESCDFGMVGFVKSLVDLTHESAIRRRLEDIPTRRSRISSLEFSEGVVMALKA